MINIVDVVEDLIKHLRAAGRVSVRSGWISGDEKLPLITIIMSTASITPLDLAASKALYTMGFQIDVWHTTARMRDELVDRIIHYFELHKAALHQSLGWFDMRFEGLRDVDEEGVYRKIIHLYFRMVG